MEIRYSKPEADQALAYTLVKKLVRYKDDFINN